MGRYIRLSCVVWGRCAETLRKSLLAWKGDVVLETMKSMRSQMHMDSLNKSMKWLLKVTASGQTGCRCG